MVQQVLWLDDDSKRKADVLGSASRSTHTGQFSLKMASFRYDLTYVQCDAPSPQSPSSVCWVQISPAPSVRDPRQLQGSCLRRLPAASATHPPDRRGREGGAPGHQGPQTGSETATYEGSKHSTLIITTTIAIKIIIVVGSVVVVMVVIIIIIIIIIKLCLLFCSEESPAQWTEMLMNTSKFGIQRCV